MDDEKNEKDLKMELEKIDKRLSKEKEKLQQAEKQLGQIRERIRKCKSNISEIDKMRSAVIGEGFLRLGYESVDDFEKLYAFAKSEKPSHASPEKTEDATEGDGGNPSNMFGNQYEGVGM